ncbi:MAG: hypothetical protein M1335_04980 [Chloroflexi bacterium]|nr:hypothetical protein [Chloroflexota bacterium]
MAVLLVAVVYGTGSRGVSNAPSTSKAQEVSSLQGGNRRTFDPGTLYRRPANQNVAWKEITLDEAKRETRVQVVIPNYLPVGSKLDAIWDVPGGGIIQTYDRGKNWIQISAGKPGNKEDFDFAKEVNNYKYATRIKSDGTRETTKTNANAIFYNNRPDGSVEPVPTDTKSLVVIKGVTMMYVDQVGGGTVRYGKNPSRASADRFGELQFWQGDMHYSVMGTNMGLEELTKIVESMLP